MRQAIFALGVSAAPWRAPRCILSCYFAMCVLELLEVRSCSWPICFCPRKSKPLMTFSFG